MRIFFLGAPIPLTLDEQLLAAKTCHWFQNQMQSYAIPIRTAMPQLTHCFSEPANIVSMQVQDFARSPSSQHHNVFLGIFLDWGSVQKQFLKYLYVVFVVLCLFFVFFFPKNFRAAFLKAIVSSFYVNVRLPQVTIKKVTANHVLMLVFHLLNITDVILKISPENVC